MRPIDVGPSISIPPFPSSLTFLSGQFVNGTPFPNDFDYNDPPIASSINHRQQPTSQRFEVERSLVHPGSCLTHWLGYMLSSGGDCA